MPNWTTTKIIVKGNPNDIERLVKRHIVNEEGGYGQFLDFDTIIPEPATQEECPDKYLIKDAADAKKHSLAYDEDNERRWFNWYEWHLDFWGTKWNSRDADCPSWVRIKELKMDKIEIWLYTAWAPATPVYQMLQEMYPKCEIVVYYVDEGGFFAGKIDSTGEITEVSPMSELGQEICQELDVDFSDCEEECEEE